MHFSENLIETDLPKGVRDFLPLKAAKAEFILRRLQDVYAAWGFRPVITPKLEFLDVLERGLGAGLQERAFRFDDRQSGRLLAFPPDITPQIARIAATRMNELPLPLRLSYNGRILRHTEQQAGKDRDIFQSGVELIGLDSPEADAEMIAMAIEAMTAVGAKEFTVDIGQVEFFRGVMDGLPLDAAAANRIADAVLRKDSSELKLLLEKAELDDAAKEEIQSLPRLFGGRDVLERAEKVVRNERSRKALDGLVQVLDVLEVYGVLEHVTVDLGELRGLNYYTGITFQGFLPGVGRTVFSGGSYNDLMAKYGYQAPATGFAFSILHLLFALDKALDSQVESGTDLLVYTADGSLKQAQELSCALRKKDYSVSRDMLSETLEDALSYAAKMDYRFLAAVSGDQVELINVVSGARTALSSAELLQRETLEQ